MNKDNCCNGKNEGSDCECEGHDHKHQHEHENEHEHEEVEMIQLTLDDDTVLDCYVLGVFEVEETEYMALLPEDDERVLLYKYKQKDKEVELKTIEDDEEFNIVSEAYYELFNEEDE